MLQKVHLHESFSSSLCATQSFLTDCPSDSNRAETFFIYQIQTQQVVASSNNAR